MVVLRTNRSLTTSLQGCSDDSRDFRPVNMNSEITLHASFLFIDIFITNKCNLLMARYTNKGERNVSSLTVTIKVEEYFGVITQGNGYLTGISESIMLS